LLEERSTPYQVCVSISESPSDGNVTVDLSLIMIPFFLPTSKLECSTRQNNSIITINFIALELQDDIQLSNDTLLFMNGTNELQQCVDLLIVDDNLVENNIDLLELIATATSGSTASLSFLILDFDSEYLIIVMMLYTLLVL
jgi:hypothetical protein